MIASLGDRLLVAQVPTKAEQFPCGYRIDVILLFDKDGTLKENNIHRLRLCP